MASKSDENQVASLFVAFIVFAGSIAFVNLTRHSWHVNFNHRMNQLERCLEQSRLYTTQMCKQIREREGESDGHVSGN